jgi:hypothetical protein
VLRFVGSRRMAVSAIPAYEPNDFSPKKRPKTSELAVSKVDRTCIRWRPGATQIRANASAGIDGGTLQLVLDHNSFTPAPQHLFEAMTTMGGVFGSFAKAVIGQRVATSDGLGALLLHHGPASPFNPTSSLGAPRPRTTPLKQPNFFLNLAAHFSRLEHKVPHRGRRSLTIWLSHSGLICHQAFQRARGPSPNCAQRPATSCRCAARPVFLTLRPLLVQKARSHFPQYLKVRQASAAR